MLHRNAATSGTPHGRREALSVLFAHLAASLDAASYIIALGLVDLITFGMPVHAAAASSGHSRDREASTSARGKHHSVSQQASPVLSTSPLWSLSRRTPRRAASDPGQGPQTPRAAQKSQLGPVDEPDEEYEPYILSRTSSSSSPWRKAWVGRTGSLDGYSLSRSAYGSSERTRHARRDSATAHDGAVHHYQRKIFSKQMQRTLRIQPYVRMAIIVLMLVSWLFFLMFTSLVIVQGVRPALATTVKIVLSPLKRAWHVVSAQTIVYSSRPS